MLASVAPLLLVSVLAAPAAGIPRGGDEDAVGPAVPPEIPAAVYHRRRLALMDEMGGCTGVIKSYARDGEPDPYFYYLTGITEPGAVLLLAPRGDLIREAIYLTPRDVEREKWSGHREEMSSALRKKYQVDEVARMRDDAPPALGAALRRHRCYANLRADMERRPGIPADLLAEYVRAYAATTVQKWEELEAMRMVKDAQELQRISKAAAITAQGHRAAARALTAGMRERQLVAEVERAFFAHGATGVAFPSIVASGENGAVLHWEKRDGVVADGDLVVVDAGASYGGYVADVSRSYPVSGHFSAEQRQVYELVLAVQDKVIAAVKPGVSMARLQRIAEDALAEAGYELPHAIGHPLGLEVHDVGEADTPLAAGMVITIEPGVYIKGKFGVRIEDMVLVTRSGCRLLSGELPRRADQVEAWMAAQR